MTTNSRPGRQHVVDRGAWFALAGQRAEATDAARAAGGSALFSRAGRVVPMPPRPGDALAQVPPT